MSRYTDAGGATATAGPPLWAVLEVAGALELFAVERRAPPREARPFVFERAAAYPTAWPLVMIVGGLHVLLEAALVAAYAWR